MVMALGMLITECQTLHAQTDSTQQAIDEKDYVLLITSYAHDSKQVTEFMQEYETWTSGDTIKLEIQIESMGVLSLDNCNEWRDKIRTIIKRQDLKYLKAIILIGQEAWASYLSLGDYIPKVPFYGTRVSKMGLEIPENIQNPTTWEPMSVSNSKLVENIGFGGATYYDFDIKANIELIMSLFPDTKHIAVLTDNSYGGLSIHANFRKVMHEHFGEIDAITIDGRKLSIRQIQHTITRLPDKTALLLGTWRVDNRGAFFTDRLLGELLSPRRDIPTFSLTGLGMRDVAIAGIYPDYREPLSTSFATAFKQIYTGEKQIEFVSIHNELTVNMGNMRKMGITPTQLPGVYKIIDNESEKVIRYRRYLIIVGVLSTVILLTLIYTIILTFKMKKQNEKLNQQANELKIAKEQAEISDKLKSAFLANISHEFRTPLNAITGFTRLLNQTNSVENIKEYLKYITDSTDKLLRLMTMIVDFAKIDTGIIDFEMVETDVASIFRKIQDKFAPKIPKEIQFDCYIPYECKITYDPEKLEQIVSIFLDNAIKFTRSGRITIGFFATPKSIKTYVTDTGIGIQDTYIPKIFDRFEKLDKFSEGTGIGLALVKTLIDKSNGDIKIVSRPDVGSRFIAEIPCQVISPTADLKKYDKTAELLDADSLIVDKQLEQPLKILVAEDNTNNYKIIESILRTHNITRATTGTEAVKAVQNDWYDIVLMDIKMPEMDGITATKEIRKFDLSTPIIAVSAYEQDIYKPKAETAGCDCFIEKPFTRNKLYTAILGIMNKK